MSSERAVGAALARLVEQGVLTEAQRDAVVAAVAQERAGKASGARWVGEVVAYAGAGLLLGGIVLLLGSSWEGLDKFAQTSALALVTIGLVVGGLVLAGGRKALFVHDGAAQTVPMRLAGALFALTSISVAVLVGTVIDDGGNDTAWMWAAVAGAVVAVLGYAALPSILGLLACAGFGNAAVAAILDRASDGNGVVVGLGIVVVGGIWFAATRFGYAGPAWAGYGVAVVTGLAGAQATGADDRVWPAYLISLLVALVCFALYRRQNNPVLVIGGGVAIAIAASEAVWDWTNGATGAFAAVLIAGAVLLVFGAAVLVRGRA